VVPVQMIPMGNAAGWLKRPQDAEQILRLDPSICKFVRFGSYTLEPRDGNVGQTFGPPINSLGLPNQGIDNAIEFLMTTSRQLHKAGRVASVSVAGFSPREFQELTRKLRGVGLIEIEINLGCPNVRVGEKSKPIFAFNPTLVAEIIRAVHEVSDDAGSPSLAYKVSPYSDPEQLERIAEVFATAPMGSVQKVVTCNTFPNASGFDEREQPLITAANGYGGLSGPSLKHIALGQVRKFRELLPKQISITCVGGISSGKDVRDAELAGASEVQVGLAYFESDDPKVFQRIAEEYVTLYEAESA
jgi:dihydroorotate dehydrogenase